MCPPQARDNGPEFFLLAAPSLHFRESEKAPEQPSLAFCSKGGGGPGEAVRSSMGTSFFRKLKGLGMMKKSPSPQEHSGHYCLDQTHHPRPVRRQAPSRLYHDFLCRDMEHSSEGFLLPFLTTTALLRLSECTRGLTRCRSRIERIKLVRPPCACGVKKGKQALQAFTGLRYLRVSHESLVPVLDGGLTSYGLKVLDLSSLRLNDEDRRCLGRVFASGAMSSLKELDLSRGRTALTAQGLSFIMRELSQGHCPQLRRINLARTLFGVGVGQVLAEAMASGHLASLQEIDFSNGELPQGQVSRLAGALKHCPDMRSLRLEGCAQSAEDAKALGMALKAGSCSRLETLSISYDDNIGDEGTLVLMGALAEGSCRHLTTLRLRHVGLTQAAATALAHVLGCGALPHLQCLELPGAFTESLGSLSVLEALKHGTCPHLHRLGLHAGRMGEAHFRALGQGVANGAYSQLEELMLSDLEAMAGDGWVHLQEPLVGGACPRLRNIDVEFAGMTSVGAKALSAVLASGSLMSLHSLQLTGNDMGDDAMAELIQSMGGGKCPMLRRLSLCYCGMGALAGRAIINCLQDGSWMSLEELETADAGLDEVLSELLGPSLAKGSGKSLKRLALQCSSTCGINNLAQAFDSGACPSLQELYITTNHWGSLTPQGHHEAQCFTALDKSLSGKTKLVIDM